jgi:hypothetical protein
VTCLVALSLEARSWGRGGLFLEVGMDLCWCVCRQDMIDGA